MLSRNYHYPVDVSEYEVAGANGHTLEVSSWKHDRLGPALHLPPPDRLNRRAVGGEGAELGLLEPGYIAYSAFHECTAAAERLETQSYQLAEIAGAVSGPRPHRDV